MPHHVLSINDRHYVIRIRAAPRQDLRSTLLVLEGWPYLETQQCELAPRKYAVSFMVDPEWPRNLETLVKVVEDSKIALFRRLTNFKGDKFDVYELQEHSRIVSAALGD